MPNLQDIAPHNMTSNTAPSPYVAAASSYWNSNMTYAPCRCFDDSSSNIFWLTYTTPTGWVSLDTGVGNSYLIYSYSIKGSPETAARSPKNWTFEGSNNGSSWTVIDTVTNETGWSLGQVRNYLCDTVTTKYRYFRLNISANNGDSYLEVGELYIYNLLPTTTPQTITSNAAIKNTTSQTTNSTARIKKTDISTIPSDATVKAVTTKTITSNTDIKNTTTKSITSFTAVKSTTIQTEFSDARIVQTQTKTILSNSDIAGTTTKSISSNTDIAATTTKTINSDARIANLAIHTILSTADVRATSSRSIDADTRIKNTTIQTILSNTNIKNTTNKAITSYADITSSIQKTILSNAEVVYTNSGSIGSDAIILTPLDLDIQVSFTKNSQKDVFIQVGVLQITPDVPYNVTITNVGNGDSLRIEWEGTSLFYNVYMVTAGPTYTRVNAYPISDEFYVVGGLQENVTYTFIVRGTDGRS